MLINRAGLERLEGQTGPSCHLGLGLRQLVSGIFSDTGDTASERFSLALLLRSLRVRVVNGETISRSLDVSTSMFMAERAACERLADLPTGINVVSKA